MFVRFLKKKNTRIDCVTNKSCRCICLFLSKFVSNFAPCLFHFRKSAAEKLLSALSCSSIELFRWISLSFDSIGLSSSAATTRFRPTALDVTISHEPVFTEKKPSLHLQETNVIPLESIGNIFTCAIYISFVFIDLYVYDAERVAREKFNLKKEKKRNMALHSGSNQVMSQTSRKNVKTLKIRVAGPTTRNHNLLSEFI